jgi:ATP-dependent DNA helicase Rep
LKLNPEQQAAVTHTEGPLLVLAGAGSGKTRVITNKIAHLIHGGIKPHHILAVTFTNKAALEMKKRVAKQLKNTPSKGLTVCTFHHFGLKFIRQHAEVCGLNKNFSILDQEDSAQLLRDMTSTAHTDPDKIKYYQSVISRWKNDLVTPTQAMQAAENERDRASAVLYEQYERTLRAYNSVDFDDLIKLPVILLQTDASIRDLWQAKIRHLLVDEYQDTNLAQYQLIKLLTGPLGHFTVVGDDDQSIYAWRGARPDNLLTLQTDYPRLTVVKLEQNYRSTQTILKSANTLIANNPHVYEKQLWSQMGAGDNIRVLTFHDEEDEARQVVLDIIRHKLKVGANYLDYALLYRGNHQSRTFEKMLREYQVPYQITGGQSFFARTEIKDIMAYLRLMANPDDDCAFLRIVNTPKREIGTSTLERLGTYAKSRHKSLLAASLEMGVSEYIPERNLAALQRFSNWVVLTGDNAQRGDTLGVIKEMIHTLQYETYLYDTQNTPKAAESRMENVWELVNWISRLLEDDEYNNLTDVVGRLSLFDLLERQQDDKPNDAVQLMTLHGAKGLEFPFVYIVGFEEELLPHRTSIEENSIDEERRLAYVGITRAQQMLTLTLCKQRKRQGDNTSIVPSRFLEELPLECLNWPEKMDKSEDKQSNAQSHLADLRALLS